MCCIDFQCLCTMGVSEPFRLGTVISNCCKLIQEDEHSTGTFQVHKCAGGAWDAASSARDVQTMTGFRFGELDRLDPSITVICFMVVIGVVIIVDYIFGISETFLASNRIYHNIFHVVYKELMAMGLLTFIVIIIEALHRSYTSNDEFYLSINFAHILVFFYSLFFAFLIFFLIRVSLYFRESYQNSTQFPSSRLLFDYKQFSTTPFGRFLLARQFIPILRIVRMTEFKIFEALFKAHYFLPSNFNFASYQSTYYARTIVNLANRSLLSWLILGIAFVLNFARVKIKLSCEEEQDGKFSSGDSLYECRVKAIQSFLISGLVLMVISVVLFVIGRICQLRLLSFAGINKALDYKDFLEYSQQMPQDEKSSHHNNYQMDAHEIRRILRDNISVFEDENDAKGFQLISTAVRSTTLRVVRYVYGVFSCICPWFVTKQDNNVESDSRLSILNHAFSLPSQHHHRQGHRENHKNGQHTRRRLEERVLCMTSPSSEHLHASPPDHRHLPAQHILRHRQMHKLFKDNHLHHLHNHYKFHGNHKINTHYYHDVHLPSQSIISGEDYLLNLLAVRRAVVSACMKHQQQQQTSGTGVTMAIGNAMVRAKSATFHAQSSKRHDNKSDSFASNNNSPAREKKNNASLGSVSEEDKGKFAWPFDEVNGNSNSLRTDTEIEQTDKYRDVPLSSMFLIGFYRYQKSREQYLSDLPAIQASHRVNNVHPSSEKVRVQLMLTTDEKRAQLYADAKAVYLTSTKSQSLEHSSLPFQTKELVTPSFIYRMLWKCFYFAMEILLLSICLYMAVWVTHMISLTHETGFQPSWQILTQFGLIIPIVFVIVALSMIVEIYSTIQAISKLQGLLLLQVIEEVCEEQELTQQLRPLILSRVAERIQEELSDNEIISVMFHELDRANLGWIDAMGLKEWLNKLNIQLSSHHFLLFLQVLQAYDIEYCNHSYWFFQSFYITERAIHNFLFSSMVVDSMGSNVRNLENPAEHRVQHLKQEVLWHQQTTNKLLQEIQYLEKSIQAGKIVAMMTATDSLNQSNTFGIDQA